MNSHPDRVALQNEIHARPRPHLRTPCAVTHVALLREAGTKSAGSFTDLNALCLQYGLAPPAPEQGHFFGDFGRFRIKWEGHGEFDDYTIYRDIVRLDAPFAEPAHDALPSGWLAALPGRLIAATQVVIVPESAEWLHRERIAAALGAVDVVGADISEGTGAVFTDLQLDAHGFTRLLIVNRTMSASQAGRQAQRLIEIETYRMMAMLGFPVARQAAGALNDVDRRLGELIVQLETAPPDEEPAMLREVTRLAAITERIAAEAGFRIAASRAYHALVEQRGRDLREERIAGLQRITEFLDRRFGPAMAFCESVDRRISATSERIDRASNLLRTRVEIEREAQNQQLLAAMNRRARLQLHLQQTVEGFSVAAITYYAVGLLAYLFKGLATAGLPINEDLATGLAVIPVVIAVAWGVRRIRRALQRRSPGEAID
ncbi:MAG: hypothetical protein RL322_2475 [Pseudomonadota bacterium]|jgi:uncharacterized membrane-anchored protein